MFAKITFTIACLFGFAHAGALYGAGISGYSGLGAYGGHGYDGYSGYGGLGGYGSYGGHGYTNYVGGHAISHQSVVKQIATPVTYSHETYAPAVSYASQYSVPSAYGYASDAYAGYGHGYGGYGHGYGSYGNSW